MEDIDIKPSSMFQIVADLGNMINWRTMLILFFIYIFLNADIFIDNCLTHIAGAVDFKTPTVKGTCIQAVILVIAYALLDLLV